MVSGIRAGNAFIEVSMNDEKLKTGLKGLQVRLSKLGAGFARAGTSIAALGTAAVGPMVAATASFVKAGDAVQKMAARTGLSTKAVSELAFAAEQSGTSMETLEGGIRGMQRSILNLQDGSSQVTDTFERLGVSLKDIEGLSPEAQFEKLAGALAAVEDDSTRAALAMRIFGRTGSQLGPLLAEGTEGIQELRKEAESLGLSVSQEDANSAAALADAFNSLAKSAKAVAFAVGSSLASALTPVLQSAAKIVARFREWVSENQGLVATIAIVGAGVTALGTAIAAAGAFFITAGAAVGAFSTIIAAVGGAVAAVAVPIAGTIAAVGALGVAFVQLGGVQATIRLISSAFQGLQSVVVGATKIIRSVWDRLAGTIVSVFSGAVNRIKSAWLGVQKLLAKGIAVLGALISRDLTISDAVKQVDQQFATGADAKRKAAAAERISRQAARRDAQRAAIEQRNITDAERERIAGIRRAFQESQRLAAEETRRRGREVQVPSAAESPAKAVEEELSGFAKRFVEQQAAKRAAEDVDPREQELLSQLASAEEQLAEAVKQRDEDAAAQEEAARQAAEASQRVAEVRAGDAQFGGRNAAQAFVATTEPIEKKQLDVAREQLSVSKEQLAETKRNPGPQFA
jgi:hypothetical protein